ncbi:MAG: dihydroorotase [Flavobacteriaceae bacterium]|nr:dihydroorotase [Flavobacteriaceae bacterium]
MKILLKDATIIDRSSPLHCQTVSLLIENGIIKEIENNINTKVDVIINDKNLHISRGWWDPSVSFGEPGYEERETLDNGLNAAAKSGFTSIGLNPDVYPFSDNHGAINHLISKSQGYTTNIHPIGCLTESSEGLQMASLYDMNEAGAITFGDYKFPTENSNLLKIALEYSQSFNGIISSYPIDEKIARNGMMNEGATSTKLGLKGFGSYAETSRVFRDIKILEHTGGRLHFSFISSKESVSLIEDAKKRGLKVTCSTSLPHLLFTDDSLINFNTQYKFFPPLRSNEDRLALREGLLSGTIDCVTAMHEPKNIEIKNLDFYSAADGSIGLESFFPLLNTLFPIEKTIQFITRGKSIFGINDFNIKVGESANITMFEPHSIGVFTNDDVLSTSKNCTYINQQTKGGVIGSLNNGVLSLRKN